MTDRTEQQGDGADPRRQMMELADTDPHEALDWIGRLDAPLAQDSIVQMAKIIAFRRIALGAPGAKSGTDYGGAFSEEELAALEEGLAAVRALQDSDPEYFQEQTETYDPKHPISSILIAAEGVWPGSVQRTLGWTRFNYFHGKQFGYAPHLNDGIPNPVKQAVYQWKLRDLPLFKSAFVIGFARSQERLSIWLLEEDLRRTENIGAAGILGTLSISSDGSYQFSPQGADVGGAHAAGDDSGGAASDTGDTFPDEVAGPNDDTTSIPWIGIALACVLLLIVISCVRQMR